ncbi:MAG: hypothetical protein K8L91_19730 [Anaerolineae bacterium]|nr:hypothetical protein [Anaerolineae bacterium]
MLSKKRLLLTTVLASFALTAGGCIDLTAVPGVAILPGDDHQVVFLEANPTFIDSGFANRGTDLLVTMELTGGGTVAYYDAELSGGFVTAFDAHPIEDAIAFVVTEEGVGMTIKLAQDGSSTDVASFPLSDEQGLAFGTQLVFSPDGRYLAIALVEFPAEFTFVQFDTLGETPELPTQLRFVAYLLDTTTGELVPLHDPTTEAVTTFVWNPAGTHLAYTAWVDTNADGRILVSAISGQEEFTFVDLCQLRIREVATGAITPIASETVDVVPEFLDNERLAYVAYDPVITEDQTGAAIHLYDMAEGADSIVHDVSTRLVSGIALAPDNSRVAWVEYTFEVVNNDGSNYASLLLSDLSFTEPVEIEITELNGVVDVPVWIPDANAVLLTASGFGGTLLVSTDGPDEETDPNTLVRVDFGTGEQTVLSDHPLLNPSILSAAAGVYAANPDEE